MWKFGVGIVTGILLSVWGCYGYQLHRKTVERRAAQERQEQKKLPAYALRGHCVSPKGELGCDTPELRLWMYANVPNVCFTDRWARTGISGLDE
jgi:hypothetical protein